MKLSEQTFAVLADKHNSLSHKWFEKKFGEKISWMEGMWYHYSPTAKILVHTSDAPTKVSRYYESTLDVAIITEEVNKKSIRPIFVPEPKIRKNDGKLRWSLVHFKSLEPLVQVLEFGAKKYTDNGWKQYTDKKEVLDSLLRHVTALSNGQETDPESNLPHIGHIQANAMFYQFIVDNEVKTLP